MPWRTAPFLVSVNQQAPSSLESRARGRDQYHDTSRLRGSSEVARCLTPPHMTDEQQRNNSLCLLVMSQTCICSTGNRCIQQHTSALTSVQITSPIYTAIHRHASISHSLAARCAQVLSRQSRSASRAGVAVAKCRARMDMFPGDKAEDKDYDLIASLSSIPSIGKAWAFPGDDPEYTELSVSHPSSQVMIVSEPGDLGC